MHDDPFTTERRAETTDTMSGTQSQIQKAIDQIQDKGPLPEIDFTQHQLENGFTISTQERVVKEVCTPFAALRCIFVGC